MNTLDDSNIEFIHFDSPETIDKFIDFIKEQNIKPVHKCCNGKGVGIIYDTINIDINKIVANFMKPTIVNIELIDTTEDVCCICREITNKALNCDKPHHLCLECIQHIKDECPYCRRKVN